MNPRLLGDLSFHVLLEVRKERLKGSLSGTLMGNFGLRGEVDKVPSTSTCLWSGLWGFQANTKTYAKLGHTLHTPKLSQRCYTGQGEKHAQRQGG